MKKHNKNSGFTLIELLVVISIIGILSSLALATYVGAKRKAEVAVFITELNQFKTALELYRSDNGRYPYEGDPGNSQISLDNNGKVLVGNLTFDGLIGSKYMSRFPKVPITGYSFGDNPETTDIMYLTNVSMDYIANYDTPSSFATCGDQPVKGKGYAILFWFGDGNVKVPLPEIKNSPYFQNYYCVVPN